MMNELSTMFNGYSISTFQFHTIIIGTGAAGYNAADRLHQYGQRDIAIITEDVNTGTSRNTGSDKQTYYKLTLAGYHSDSVGEMAETLFSGKCMDGDIALCEAALSAQSFLRLVELGVPFPHNAFGEYVGYKTDHDPRCRATSVGPYTSKKMTEALEQSVTAKNIKVFDRLLVIKILTVEKDDLKHVEGVICLDLNRQESEQPFVLFQCQNIVYATGGPAGIYADSVYPEGHFGMSGIAYEAGVVGKNLTEWQYGMASVKPRWNVSGTYMQVLPMFFSTDQEGEGKKEFLYDFFDDETKMLNMIFLKGYQWPFDVRKIKDGSSIIDILVYIELNKGRRVFLDFRNNPKNKKISFDLLDHEVKTYLTNAGACSGTPIERLAHMNQPAIDFYQDKGVDLYTEPLEIALSAQHNNGGLDVDCWWQTNVKGFFAVGEVAATHGVYRPGGSALNSGQVGGIRVAQYITKNRNVDSFGPWSEQTLNTIKDSFFLLNQISSTKQDNLEPLWLETTKKMSQCGGPIRNEEQISALIAHVTTLLGDFQSILRVSPSNRSKAFRLWDILVSQQIYLQAMDNYLKTHGKSRGSALYTNLQGEKYSDKLPDTFRFVLDDDKEAHLVQETHYHKEHETLFNWRNVREIPKSDDFFENVWRAYRKDFH